MGIRNAVYDLKIYYSYTIIQIYGSYSSHLSNLKIMSLLQDMNMFSGDTGTLSNNPPQNPGSEPFCFVCTRIGYYRWLV